MIDGGRKDGLGGSTGEVHGQETFPKRGENTRGGYGNFAFEIDLARQGEACHI